MKIIHAVFTSLFYGVTALQSLRAHIKKSTSIHQSFTEIDQTTTKELEYDWNFIDAVYLITTTQSDNTRLEATRGELAKVNLWDRVKVKRFRPDDEDRVRGCYTSHINVLKEVQNEFRGKSDYRALILEDNLETTLRVNPKVLESVAEFSATKSNWDIFHLAYMMYVPNMSLNKLTGEDSLKPFAGNVVQMVAGEGSAVGTSSYLVSRSGLETILKYDAENGYSEAIPNIMAKLFPVTRYAAYPMLFHRAAKISSLVNPQLDNFRKIMFSPAMYTSWERLMVSTSLQNNQLFPGLAISLLGTIVATIYAAATSGGESGVLLGPLQILVAFPLGVVVWGASLFQGDATGAGFAPSAQKQRPR